MSVSIFAFDKYFYLNIWVEMNAALHHTDMQLVGNTKNLSKI